MRTGVVNADLVEHRWSDRHRQESPKARSSRIIILATGSAKTGRNGFEKCIDSALRLHGRKAGRGGE